MDRLWGDPRDFGRSVAADSEPPKMKRSLKIAVVSCTLLLMAWLSFDTIQDRQDSATAVGTRAPNPIVGIWKGQHGTILDLRPDGTVRSRSIGDSTNAIHYYKYRLNGDTFFIDYSAKPDEYLRRMRQAAFGMTVDRYDLAKLNNSELHLTDPASGETFVFERTEGPILVAAP